VSDEAKEKEEKKRRRKKKKKKQKNHVNQYVDFFPNFLYSNKIDDNDLCNETSKYDFNTISINKPIAGTTDIYYFPYKINISSVRSIDDSMHARTLEQTQ
jgi:hypothetical protein